MSVKITVDFENMSKDQIKSVTEFMCSYPIGECGPVNAEVKIAALDFTTQLEPEVHEENVVSEIDEAEDETLGLELDSHILETNPEDAFGKVKDEEADDEGNLWDPTIHSSPKKKTKAGLWALKRGVREKAKVDGAETLGKIKAGLNELLNIKEDEPEVSKDPRSEFVALIGRVSAAIQSKKIVMGEVSEICNKYGVPVIALLASKLDLVPKVAEEIDSMIASRS